MKHIKNYEDYFVDEAGNVYSKRKGSLKKLKPILTHYGYYEANLRIDVLMSYKDLILKSKGHVSKTDSANKYVNSGYTTEVRTEYKVVPIPIKLNPNGQIIMIVWGD